METSLFASLARWCTAAACCVWLALAGCERRVELGLDQLGPRPEASDTSTSSNTATDTATASASATSTESDTDSGGSAH